MCSKDRDGVRNREVSFDYRKGPSFSSTLLEHIYKSIDGDDGEQCGMKKKQEEVDDAVQRVNLLEKWMMEKKKNADVMKNNKIAEPAILKKLHYIDNDPLFFSSGSNSSDSNSSLFSDHDPVPVVLPTTKTRSSCFLLPPKPIRTREVNNTGRSKTEQDDDVPASTRSRALKLYSHLKKMKQPISPGVKLTIFINSILSKSNTKKQQSNKGSTTSSAAVRPTCSSASSFTRTCLTTTTTSAKTTSSTRTNYSSVKLAPVNVKIKTDDDDDPDPPHHSAKLHDRALEQNLRLRPQVINRGSNSKPISKISVGRVSEDARSDCSDDLFELDHLKLSNINGGDLPVFETTRISSTTNHSHRNRVLVLKHSDCS